MNGETKDFFIACIAKARKGPVGPEGRHTIGEFITAVFAVETEADATRFASSYLAFNEFARTQPWWEESKFTSEQIVKANIGWCFGEGMAPEKIAMWKAACGAAHPVLAL